MLSNADVDLAEKISDLADFGVEAGYLVPTETGLIKSIMDAHESLRAYLASEGIHNFESQGQGPEYKVILPCKVLGERGWIPSKVSLYRPNTKSGDPRIWISGLKNHAAANNLLVFLVHEEELFVANASRDSWRSLFSSDGELNALVSEMSSRKTESEAELLGLLDEISNRGFVRSLAKRSDSGVGETLEHLLGISRNSSKAPDFKGIELKATRKKVGTRLSTNRSTLFSLVPNWKMSACKSGSEILEKYGYETEEGRKALQVTLSSTPNSQGLFLSLDQKGSVIENFHRASGYDEKVVMWRLEDLHSSLSKKHRATFWIKAEARLKNDHEEFHYNEVVSTSRPLVQNFGPLVSAGKIQMDYTLSQKTRGDGSLYPRDHGYLWKIRPRDLHLLFPKPQRIPLGK